MAKRQKQRRQAPPASSQATAPAWWSSLVTRTRRHSPWICSIALVAIVTLGWHVRFEGFYQWRTMSQTFFIDGEPVLINSDGYYYLRLARDLVHGTYAPVDEKRNVPDYPRRPSPPPLLSSLTVLLHAATGISLNWIAIFLPTVLGSLVAIPVYLLSKGLGGGTVMRLTAALMAVLGLELVDRTRVGFYDTDSLNVVFTLLSAYFALTFAVGEGRRRYWSFAGAVLTYLSFLWWWEQVPHLVVLASLLPLVFALVVYERRRQASRTLFYGLMAIVLAAALLGFRDPGSLPGKVRQLLDLVAGRRSGYFPVVEVAELIPVAWSDLIDLTTGHWASFLLSVLGFTALVVEQRRLMLFLAIPVALAILPAFFGERFAIFTVPVVALGLGYAFDRSMHLAQSYVRPSLLPLASIGLLGLIPLTAYPAYEQAVDVLRGPVTHRTVEGIEAVASTTEEDSVIWTSWTAGYALTDRTGRPTIIDGQSMQGEARYYAALPLAESNQRLAANFMQFYVHWGIEGIHRIYRAFDNRPDEGMAFIKTVLSTSPQQAEVVLDAQSFPASKPFSTTAEGLRFFFPPRDRPLYLLLHKEHIYLSGWFYYGSWDLVRKSGTHILTVPYFGVTEKNGQLHLNQETLDKARGGSVVVSSRDIPEHRAKLAHLFEHDGGETRLVEYDKDGTIAFEWIKPMGFGVLMSKELSGSVFNQLFIRHRVDGQFFQSVKLKTPEYQVWRVNGDRL